MNGFKPPSTETLLTINGIVQGVFFRAITKRLAESLGIKGYVRNLSNGGVEICITEGNVEELIARLKQEPFPIRIDSIEKKERPLSEHCSSFEVKYY